MTKPAKTDPPGRIPAHEICICIYDICSNEPAHKISPDN